MGGYSGHAQTMASDDSLAASVIHGFGLFRNPGRLESRRIAPAGEQPTSRTAPATQHGVLARASRSGHSNLASDKKNLNDAIDRARAFLIHALAAFVFSVIDASATILMRLMLFGNSTSMTWWNRAQFMYFTEVDLFLMTYAVIVAFTLASESHRRALESARFEAVLAETRLKCLEARLEPHFLFNTLHAISTLVYTKPHQPIG